MVAKAGQMARKSGEIKCIECEGTVYVEEGEEIPSCPCGGMEFDEQTKESASKSTQQSKKRKTA